MGEIGWMGEVHDEFDIFVVVMGVLLRCSHRCERAILLGLFLFFMFYGKFLGRILVL